LTIQSTAGSREALVCSGLTVEKRDEIQKAAVKALFDTITALGNPLIKIDSVADIAIEVISGRYEGVFGFMDA
jgi:hypothetical protein